MINFDFKFDLAEYLAKSENPPVKSLADILDRGLFHAALETQLRTRNAVEQRESDASRRVRVKRTAIRQAVEAVLAEHRLTALVYPTLRRKPARIGDLQRFGNCQLSAHSGLPALAIPAGFSTDGVPVGMDLLGSAFTEQDFFHLATASNKRSDCAAHPSVLPPWSARSPRNPEPRQSISPIRLASASI